MREIGISPRFSRDKFVPLQTKQRYSTRDISGEVFLTLFFRGFVPFLSLADFVSRNKKLQVADLQRLKSCFEELVTATTSNLQKPPPTITPPSHTSQNALTFCTSHLKYVILHILTTPTTDTAYRLLNHTTKHSTFSNDSNEKKINTLLQ